jgi:hypothetical protein
MAADFPLPEHLLFNFKSLEGREPTEEELRGMRNLCRAWHKNYGHEPHLILPVKGLHGAVMVPTELSCQIRARREREAKATTTQTRWSASKNRNRKR